MSDGSQGNGSYPRHMGAGDMRDLLRGLTVRLRDADMSINAAAVAYNAFLALVPLGLALLGAAAFIGGSEAALQRVESTLSTLAPQPVREFIIDLMVDSEARLGGQQGWLILVSVLLALLLGSRAVAALQRALAHVELRVERRPAVELRLVAIALTIGGGLVLLVTSFLIVVGNEAIDFLVGVTGVGFLDTLWAWLRVPLPVGGLYLFLLALYRWGPPEPLPKSWLAALVGTAGALASSLIFGIYLNLAPELGATFGVLGAVALALVWLYLGTFAILLGAVVVAYTLRWKSSRNGEAG
ncbi:MAG: YihY/virulence factor BrkB family protein [Acidimicrobiia bacterium]|nr:YihY/virulence factor BrkB family protein [Acidimicrobiia bacterium]